MIIYRQELKKSLDKNDEKEIRQLTSKVLQDIDD